MVASDVSERREPVFPGRRIPRAGAPFPRPLRATAPRPAGPPGVVTWSLWLLVLGSLLTALPGPAALGELRGEGTLVGGGVLILLAALTGMLADVRALRNVSLYLPLAGMIAASFLANAHVIAAAHFIGRSGPEKFVSALLVLAFYLTAFYALSAIMVVYGVRLVLGSLRPVAIFAAVMLILEMTVELATWFSPPLRQAWLSMRFIWTHETYAPLFRIVAFASEPSFGAISVLGVLGLLGAQWVLDDDRAGPPHRLKIAALAIALVGLQLFADARTFFIGALGGLMAWTMLVPLKRALPPAVKSAVIVLGPLPVQAFMIWTVLHADHAAQTISNVSRSVGMVTSLRMWAEHPLLGHGLGQYGFHFRALIPAWGLQSWEVSRFIRPEQFDLIKGLPPSFSLFSRVGAELGLLGFAAWILPPLYAVRQALRRRPDALTTAMVCAFAAQLWTGLSLDSFRNIHYWFWLAALLAWPLQSQAAAFVRPPTSRPARG